MTAADVSPGRDTSAAPGVVLRDEVFDTLTAKLGATNDSARARLFGVDRATISRLRKRRFTPSMEVAMRMADVLSTTVDELFERVGV